MKIKLQVRQTKRRDTEPPTEEVRFFPVSEDLASADLTLTIKDPAEFGKLTTGDQVTIEIKKEGEAKKPAEPKP